MCVENGVCKRKKESVKWNRITGNVDSGIRRVSRRKSVPINEKRHLKSECDTQSSKQNNKKRKKKPRIKPKEEEEAEKTKQ